MRLDLTANPQVRIYQLVKQDGEQTWVQRDWDWAVAKYGPRLGLYPAPAGPAFRLVELREREDFSGCVVKVLDRKGLPFSQIIVCEGWRQGPALNPYLAPTGGLPAELPRHGLAAETNMQGDAGFGWGPGEYYDPLTQPGPHYFWIGDSSSDVLHGIGMLPNTEHAHLEPTFQWLPAEEPEPPQPPATARELVTQALELLEKALEALA